LTSAPARIQILTRTLHYGQKPGDFRLHPSQPVASNTAITAPENRAYFPALDGIRACAFLAVFAHHYMHLELGWVGVDMFFVLSGFLITGILYDARDDAHRARTFYIRRALRIFPLYYLVLLALFLLFPVAHWQWDWRWIVWPLYVGNWVLPFHPHGLDLASLRLMNGWLYNSRNVPIFIGHFWSLCVEEQFYLVWPWVVFWVKDRRKLIALAAAIVILEPILRLIAQHTLPAVMVSNEIVAHNTLFRLDTLMMGALVALLYRGPARDTLFKTANYSIWAVCMMAAAVLLAFVVRPALLHNHGFGSYVYTIGFSIIAYGSATLLVASLRSGSLFFRILSLRPLRWIGRVSYGAYVFHDLFHAYYSAIGSRLHLHAWPIGLVATFALAALSFRFIETPFLNLKARFTAPAS
jgi:peptidoglycan/LPS O-acetylase OafA/YrhL